MFYKKSILIFHTILFFTISNLYGQNVPTVAKVNNQIISLETILRAANELPNEIKKEPFLNYYEDLIQHLIDVTVLAQEAKLNNLQNDPDVKSSIDYVTQKILMEAYLNQYVENLVNEKEILNSYNNLVNDKTSREEINAKHILLDTSEQAKEIISNLLKGSSFENLAKSFSTGPSGPNGGDLGWFSRGQMVPAFETAAFKLKVGEFTKSPIQTQFGWHIIKLENKRIADPPEYNEVKEKIKNNLQRQLIVKKIQELRSNSKITFLSAPELEPLISKQN